MNFATLSLRPLHSYLANSYAEIMEIKSKGNIRNKPIHIVLGNQSGDMDSISSAIALSYWGMKKIFHLPVINILRDEMPLRGDVLKVFKTLKIDPHKLLYKEDLPFLLSLAEKKSLSLTLVDHNRLAPSQEDFKECVVKIVDHHHDENIDYPLLVEKHIKPVGSNSTLIAQMILSSSIESCSPEVAHLLLSAILLDTENLLNKAVTTDEDITFANLLILKAAKYYDTTLFNRLLKSRNTVKYLTPDLLLKKDYKAYKEGELLYGIASIPQSVVWSSENRFEWKEAFAKFLKKTKISLLCALVCNKHERNFIVYIPSLQLQAVFLKHIKKTECLNDTLILKQHYPDEGLLFFALKTPLKRKQLQPLLKLDALLRDT